MPPVFSRFVARSNRVNADPRSRSSCRFRVGLWVAALCSISLIASTANGIGLLGGVGDVSVPGIPDLRGFPQATYYRVTHPDMRLCPSPMCGGVFVERVNKRRSRCADGTVAKECHAAVVDFSALGLSPEDESRLQAGFVAKRVLVRGDLELVELGSVSVSVSGRGIPTLFVTDAWRGVTGTQARPGSYFGVVDSGIDCITFPCPSFTAFKLNGRRIGWLHGLDLASSGATSEQISLGLAALANGPGLIGFGRLRRIEGPAGWGKELRTSEFYTKVAGSLPAACGGFTYPPNPACADREFCEQPAGTCFVADLPGTCQEIPEVCIEIYDPVCGCDGVTYSNECHRQQAQVALDHLGSCEIFPPIQCGTATCTGGTVCCNPLLGICTPPGLACIQ